jgi:hypothetical protein
MGPTDASPPFCSVLQRSCSGKTAILKVRETMDAMALTGFVHLQRKQRKIGPKLFTRLRARACVLKYFYGHFFAVIAAIGFCLRTTWASSIQYLKKIAAVALPALQFRCTGPLFAVVAPPLA